jgi:predicted ABC-class ATPase
MEMNTLDQLKRTLSRIAGKGYKAYKDLKGSYDFTSFHLYVDHVQGDPFAAPSKIRLRVPMDQAGFPQDLFFSRVRRFALQDFVARRVCNAMASLAKRGQGSSKSGVFSIDAGGQEVLERSACKVTDNWVEARIYVGLPAAGRRILGRDAEKMLCVQLPQIVEQGLMWRCFPRSETKAFVECIENQEHIRHRLAQMKLVAFVSDGAILPRESGNSQKPLTGKGVVRFKSPPSLHVEIDVPNPVSDVAFTGKTLSGMGIPRGTTLIVGGGYHGKSTLLQALERGVYAHIPGDGREYVVTCPDTVKIRAEDGRRIEQVDISPFITNLPYRLNTQAFCTANASGSTSQAANIIEALEMGAQVLLLDEDTSATNFMVRDVRMQALVHKEFEPITPFIERVAELYQTFGVSTVLVMGGCGDYFDAADTVIMMREYFPQNVTSQAKNVAAMYVAGRHKETDPCPFWQLNRIPVPESFDPSRGRKQVKIDAKAVDRVLFGTDVIDLRGVEQLIDVSQSRAVGLAIHLAAKRFMDGKKSLQKVLKALDRYLEEKGLDPLDPFYRTEKHPGSLARPRKFEIAAAINRLRTARFLPPKNKKGDVLQ